MDNKKVIQLVVGAVVVLFLLSFMGQGVGGGFGMGRGYMYSYGGGLGFASLIGFLIKILWLVVLVGLAMGAYEWAKGNKLLNLSTFVSTTECSCGHKVDGNWKFCPNCGKTRAE